MLHIITHELLHALGFDGGHANHDLYPSSIMHTSPILTQFGTTQGNLLMHRIDIEALAAAYGALLPGDSALSLGAWDRQAVRVHGNTFMQTDGDGGIVTGVFFGEAHEAMGGTLERDDLTAAFGGKR